MQLNETVQDLIVRQDWLGLALFYWDLLGSWHWAIPGFVVLFVVLAMLAPKEQAKAATVKELEPVSRAGYKPRGPIFIPFSVGNVTLDLQPRATETIHTLIGGTSRTGKSTSVLPLFDLPIGVLCIALDITPIEKKVHEVGGWIWTNDPVETTYGLNLLGGASVYASEGVVGGFPKSEGNIGDWQRAAREVIWDHMDAIDAQGIERSLPLVIEALERPTRDTELQRVCRAWARKLRNLNRIIGPTIGPDLDLVHAMRRGDKVICRLNRFLSPDDAPFLAGLLLVHARRVMQEANVPFILIIEEAGQAALAQGHISPIAQAGAARGVPTIVITQNMSTLPIEVRNNFHVTVAFAQEDKHERDVAADRLELKSDHLRRSSFPDRGVGWAYVRAPGIDTRLVHLRPPARPAKRSYVSEPTPPLYEEVLRRRTIVREVGTPVMPLPALPMPAVEIREVLSQIDRDQGDCWLWLGSKDKDGYGVQRWGYLDEPEKQKNNRPAHQVVWEIVNGCPFPRGTNGKRMDWRHRRTCPRHCVNPYHGVPGTRRQNVQERWADARVGGAGGL